MPTPTQEQIDKVITNLTNMQSWNDYVYIDGISKINNAYLLLSEQQSTDKGLVWMLNILEAAFKVAGATLGPGGAFVANLLTGMMGSWTSNPPGSLNKEFANLGERAEQTKIAIDLQLATYCDGLRKPETVQSTWDTAFTFNGQTASIGDLANATFPKENEALFITMAKEGSIQYDQQLWKQLLTDNFRVYQRDQYRTDDTDQNTPPVKWVQEYIAYYKNTFYTYFWHQGDGGDCSLWIADEFVIAAKASNAWLNGDSCDYIFQDSTPGTIINKNGLFCRKDVFEFLGIQYPLKESISLSKEYLKSRQEGKTLLSLFQSQGREAIENQIIQKAQEDAVFALELTKNPKQTIEEFFDIKIPELVHLTVVLEDPMNFGLVIRGAKKLGPASTEKKIASPVIS